MYFCGYFVYSNVQTRRILAYYQYSGSFSVKTLVFEPPGVPIYRVPINCYATDIEYITSKLNPKVFLWLLCVFLLSKLGEFQHIINIRGHFRSRFWFLTPWGDRYRVPPTLMQSILKIQHQSLTQMYFCGYYVLSNEPTGRIFA